MRAGAGSCVLKFVAFVSLCFFLFGWEGRDLGGVLLLVLDFVFSLLGGVWMLPQILGICKLVFEG